MKLRTTVSPLLAALLIAVVALQVSGCGSKTETDVASDTTAMTTPAPAENPLVAKLKAIAPPGTEAGFHAESGTATLTYHEASTVDAKAVMHRHMNSAINYARAAFAESPDVKAVNIQTTADVKDATGATKKETLIEHTFGREPFMSVNWEELKGKPIGKHLHNALMGGKAMMHHQFAEASAAIGYIGYDNDGSGNAPSADVSAVYGGAVYGGAVYGGSAANGTVYGGGAAADNSGAVYGGGAAAGKPSTITYDKDKSGGKGSGMSAGAVPITYGGGVSTSFVYGG